MASDGAAAPKLDYLAEEPCGGGIMVSTLRYCRAVLPDVAPADLRLNCPCRNLLQGFLSHGLEAFFTKIKGVHESQVVSSFRCDFPNREVWKKWTAWLNPP